VPVESLREVEELAGAWAASPEAAPARSRASVADRLVALALDAVALTAVAFVAAVAVSLVVGPAVRFHDGAGSVADAVEVHRGVAALDAVVVAALTAAYFVGSWRRGASPGQRALGLTVAGGPDGSPPALGAAARRWLVLVAPFSLVALLGAAVPGLGLLQVPLALWYLALTVSVARGPGGRGWHDRLAGTAVTRPTRPLAWGEEDAGGDR
jgi:hypothetical protein